MPPLQKTQKKEIARRIPGLKPGISTVPKMWNKFVMIKDVAVLSGHYSQGHKRFKGKNVQGASVCVMACAYCVVHKMELWTPFILDEILENGTDLHLKSIASLTNKCNLAITLDKVFKYFFIGDVRFTMKISPDVLKATLRIDQNPAKVLQQLLADFFAANTSGVFCSQNRYFAMWKDGGGFFLFDPVDHDIAGEKWMGLPGLGYCHVMRYQNLDKMALTLINNVNVRYNTKIQMTPVSVEKAVKINTKPPEVYDPNQPPPPLILATTSKSRIPGAKKPNLGHVTAHKKEPETGASQERIPDTDESKMTAQEKSNVEVKGTEEETVIPNLKVPVERPTLKEQPHFVELPNHKGGILRASTHQCDPKFSKYQGKQSLGNAVAALVMLKKHKAKHWIRRILDDTLRLGEVIHHNSYKLPRGQICQKVELEEKLFTPIIEHRAMQGKLQSQRDDLLDLLPALTNFLLDHDACVLVGPVTVAIWSEDGFYYMFDPNERNALGGVKDCPPGVACVTRFETISDLVALYMGNLDVSNNTEYFYLCKCVIEDYVELPDPWYNFTGVAPAKWILRGTFSQADRRFPKESRNTQCTANATMALVFTEFKEEKEWNAETVDRLLMTGDEFYRNSVEALKEKNKFVDAMLMVDELKRSFPLDNKEVNLEIEDCLVNGIVNAKSETGILNLRRGFQQFFETNEAGIVTAHSLSLAVWKRGPTFYYFDSHDRDPKGVVCNFGTACVLRVLNIEDLAKAILTNLGPDRQDLFNISRIGVKLLDITEDGVIQPPLNHYVAVNDFVAILRSNMSENHEVFELNRGKQTIPMCFAALGYQDLTPAQRWTQDDVDYVLMVGDGYYVQAMEANKNRVDVPEEEDIDEISTGNCKPEFQVGMNKFTFELEDFAQGKVQENLEEALNNLNVQEADEGQDDENRLAKFRSVFESDYLKASMWRDNNSYYLFDPKARDESGQIIGKDDWSVVISDPAKPGDGGEENVETKAEPQEQGGGDNFGDRAEPGEDDVDEKETNINDYEEAGDEEAEGEEEEGEGGEEEEEEETPEEEEEPVEVKEKHSSHYWREMEQQIGKSCVLRFSRLEDLYKHILESTPPNKREEAEFTLKKVKLLNTPIVKELLDPDVGEEYKDALAGDWNLFKEVDYCKWILRGTKTLDNQTFPEANRGKQEIAMCLTSIAFVNLYAISKYKPNTVDGILMYGDRLYSANKKKKQLELKTNRELALSDEEIEMLVNNAVYDIADYVKKICIAESLVTFEIQPEDITGDIHSNLEDILDVKRGLEKFFENKRFGILNCKNLSVAVWKLPEMFYMFDAHPRGPNGTKSTLGVACITRFKNLEDLVKIFLGNLPAEGLNTFAIHAIQVSKSQCPRTRQPEEKPVTPKKLGGFTQVMAGKEILRGELKQDFSKFDRAVHIHSAPVAFVVLTMSLVQEPEAWTHLTVDQILLIAEQLYVDTVRKLGFRFNPWTDKIDIYKVNNDFKVGSFKANCELRFTDQKGLVDPKNPKLQNLRQGIERFFEENTQGILLVDKFALAIWEEAKEDDTYAIYMYDPNSRGATGLPMMGGTACALKFCNAKILADHVISILPNGSENKGMLEYQIVPVEICVGAFKTRRKAKKQSLHGTALDQSTKLEKHQTTIICPKDVQSLIGRYKPPCKSLKIATLEKKILRDMAEMERSKKEEKRNAAMGRSQYHKVSEEESILRGLKVMQQGRDITSNVVAFVMTRVCPNLDKWNYKQIDLIMETGNQLYIDSCVAYKIDDGNLDLNRILRKFFLRNIEAHLTIYRPIRSRLFTVPNVSGVLANYFVQETFCMMYYKGKYVSVFFKGGFYYVFDPYKRNLSGDKSSQGHPVMMKFSSLDRLADKIVNNLDDGENVEEFFMVLLGIKNLSTTEGSVQENV